MLSPNWLGYRWEYFPKGCFRKICAKIGNLWGLFAKWRLLIFDWRISALGRHALGVTIGVLAVCDFK